MKPGTRERLVETARNLFWEQGYSATGVAQILEAADARSGSFYYFFPTKEDLLLAVLEQYKEMLDPAVVRPVFERVNDPIERIFGILDGYRALLLSTKFQHGCPIGNLALEVGNAQPTARKLVAENFTGWRKVIEMCLVDAAKRLPADLDREQLALFVLTTMEGAVMLARSYQTIDAYDAAIARLRDYFSYLLAPGKGRTRRREPAPSIHTLKGILVPFHPENVNYLAVLVAGIMAFAIGAIWYTVLFGKMWRNLLGITEEKMKEMQTKMNPPIFFGGMLVSYFVLAYAMATILSAFADPTAGTGVLIGLFMWLAIGAVMMTNHIASGHKIGIYLIDVGCVLIYTLAMGALLAVWR